LIASYHKKSMVGESISRINQSERFFWFPIREKALRIQCMSKSEKKIIECLNRIFQAEMAGIVRYLHYSFMIMGHNRIPIQKWFRDQASESTAHAVAVGELITSYGGHPPVLAAKMEESNKHGVDQILNESLTFEEETLKLYKDLVQIAVDSEDIALEEFARGQVMSETNHIFEVKKMLRKN